MYDRMQELYRFSHCSEPFFKHMEFCQNQERFDDRVRLHVPSHQWGHAVHDRLRYSGDSGDGLHV